MELVNVALERVRLSSDREEAAERSDRSSDAEVAGVAGVWRIDWSGGGSKRASVGGARACGDAEQRIGGERKPIGGVRVRPESTEMGGKNEL
ncbi:hypothetical protein AXF42_Ash021702 [Apostasia shenzhenica]|uniref:Uncharacterized protein n=1 Tax=Apostasia shenzhenica TaxID=1088818 RepID=A0A2H9ZX36_9ASPA|nr:hypothetical protein AXF42_Ash021702 [Apostasia shenzhenica]